MTIPAPRKACRLFMWLKKWHPRIAPWYMEAKTNTCGLLQHGFPRTPGQHPAVSHPQACLIAWSPATVAWHEKALPGPWRFLGRLQSLPPEVKRSPPIVVVALFWLRFCNHVQWYPVSFLSFLFGGVALCFTTPKGCR